MASSHQTAFNMRHKVLIALQEFLEDNPVLLSGIAEFDETFVLDCYKGGPIPEEAGRGARKHGTKAAKRGYINRYNAMFSIAFRCANNLTDMLFSSICTTGRKCYWHSVKDVRNYHLVML